MNQGTVTSQLNALELEVIALFVRVADLLNLPRSLGELYGVLYMTSDPMCLDDLRLKLNISKGSTSQGLKILRSFGAIRMVYVAGDRRDFYLAETSLRKIASGFASEQIQPHLESGAERVDHMQQLLATEVVDHPEWAEKIERLENWQHRAGQMMPILLKLMGGKS
jgi:DNA-binding transcriptional regulator GbsR (MarR family)